LLNEATWGTNGVATARDGQTIATAENRSAGASGVNPLVVLRNGATGRAVTELGRSETSFDTRLAFASDGQALFTWDDRVLERWDAVAARQAGRLPAPGRAYFRGLVVHPSGRLLVTVSGDGQARYWEPADLSPIRVLKWGIGKLHAVAVSADGTLAAAGGDKGQVVVWDVEV
jgi:WD40 repeat protein